jgi:hypothetical protein
VIEKNLTVKTSVIKNKDLLPEVREVLKRAKMFKNPAKLIAFTMEDDIDIGQDEGVTYIYDNKQGMDSDSTTSFLFRNADCT